MVDPEIFAAVQEMIEKDSAVKEVLGPGSAAACVGFLTGSIGDPECAQEAR